MGKPQLLESEEKSQKDDSKKMGTSNLTKAKIIEMRL